MTTPPAVQLTDVNRFVDAGEIRLHIIKDISLEVPRSQILAIVGPSGSGKSTLMGLIGGLDTPSDGQVCLDGVDISRMNERRLTFIRNEKIGFVFQFFHLIPTLTALDNVALPIRFAQNPRYNPHKRARELLNTLGLSDRTHHRPSQLSGGQQQRVAIARALANGPPIVLCDEPTGNLDQAAGQRIVDTLHEIREQTQTTIIIVTHDPVIAEQADRVVTLVDGRIIEDRILKT